jgi:3-phenylpropionate/trans-cinnamate dioxygenase ferredoxin component
VTTSRPSTTPAPTSSGRSPTAALVWDNEVECSLHGSTFDLDDGRPSSLPATQARPDLRRHLDGDDVLVDTASTNGAPFPDH